MVPFTPWPMVTKYSLAPSRLANFMAGEKSLLPLTSKRLLYLMWLAGVRIERIQALCGHKDKATPEIYVKSRWRETVASNNLKIGA
ncbi:hypothetical protein C7440_1243 [Pusillimonas noertemannii]|uniref:Phage integrase family protein n=2 Tax=Pusillimonas noertemannii TaxID=305977 RepID=A0A2U1CSE8_9BURK|nr:hypothetical protein C7440_1243 [Pusillimonas noertemannii]